MTLVIAILLTIPAMLLFLLALFFTVEVIGAFLPRRAFANNQQRPDKITVIIPAHNEGEGLKPTLADVSEQLTDKDQVIVVADNCDDNTAPVARAAGVECLERADEDRRGKGYALQYALDAIKEDPPVVVFFIDADCRLGPDAIVKTSAAALDAMRPAQALYLMQASQDAPPQRRVSEFAWTLINDVRMSGLYRLFDTTRLTGAGMALPWALAEKLNVGTGEIVEDLSLSLDLTRDGAAPVFISDALVTSEFPSTEEAAAKQRARWEHGSLSLAKRNLGGLFLSSVMKSNARLAAMALDLAIPPLTVFAAMIIAMLVVSSGAAFLFDIITPLKLMGAAFILFILSVVAAWAGFGRKALPLSALGDVAGYIASKRKVYGGEARQSTKTWTRTDRTPDASPHNDGS